MRRLCLCATLSAVQALQGCFTYVPLQTGPPPVGQSVKLEISDRGRVELGERLGRGVSAIEGRLTAMDADRYVINVASVAYLSGERSRWSGESVSLNRSIVDQTGVRTLSKSRTWVAAGTATLVVGYFIATRGLLGSFSGSSEDGPPEPLPSLRLRFSLTL